MSNFIHVGTPDVPVTAPAGAELQHAAGRNGASSGYLVWRDDMASKKTSEDYILLFRAAHGDLYDYSKTVYVNAITKIRVACHLHGDFFQTPSNHLRGSGCPQCARKARWANTFKQRCKALGIDYWRALKRREAGMTDEKIFREGYVRADRGTGAALRINGIDYPNIEAACRALRPPANSTTIGRWIRGGMVAEEAFERIPNPGYAAGLIYLVTHLASRKQYVGLTIQTLERRWKYHVQQARADHVKGAASLHAAIREHGPEAFAMAQIDSGTTKEDLEQKERRWIKTYGTLIPVGYNVSVGGVSGGANCKAKTVDGQRFPSARAAAHYISVTRGIGIEAAKARLRHDRIDVRSPAKKGESLVKTPAYKSWSRIVHSVLNPNSKSYIPGMNVHQPWLSFSAFLAEVGQPPKQGMAFTRLDKVGGFFPDNCAWLTKSEASKINAGYMRAVGTPFSRKRLSPLMAEK
jgi:hypothetical protein